MDNLQKYLRECSVDSKIASSVQKNIKEIVGTDGDVNDVNDRLKAFTATATGQKILGMARNIMQEINLPYTEQVFLQETGFYPGKESDPTKEEGIPTINNLLEMYAKLEEPITQTDGLADDSDVITCTDDWGSNSCRSGRLRTPVTETPNARFRREYLEAFARGEDYNESCGGDSWVSVDDSADISGYTIPDSTLGSVRHRSIPNISGVNPLNWTQSTICSGDESGWETTAGSVDVLCGFGPEPPVYYNTRSQPRPSRTMSLNRTSSSGVIRGDHIYRTPSSHSVSIVEAGPNHNSRSVHSSRRSHNYSSEPSFFTCSPMSTASSVGPAPVPAPRGNIVPRQADWNNFDSENPANEQRFFEINDMQKTYLGTALNMLDVLDTVVQVGHTIILNANVYVDERDTKQFTIGGLLPDYINESQGPANDTYDVVPGRANLTFDGTPGRANQTFNMTPRRNSVSPVRRALFGEPRNVSTPHTPYTPAVLRTPGAPVVAQSGRARRGPANAKRLNFSQEPQYSMNHTFVKSAPSLETPRHIVPAMRSPGSARLRRHLNLSRERHPIDHNDFVDDIIYVDDSLDASQPFVNPDRCARDRHGRPVAVIGGRRHGFFPDENAPQGQGADPNLTPVDYAEFELPDEFDMDMMRDN